MSIYKLLKDPSDFDFYQAVYTIERQLFLKSNRHRKVGYDSLPRNELIRFKSVQQLGFPGPPISDVKLQKDKTKFKETSVDMSVSFMGLTGTSGVLPQHYTELILERLRKKDTGMCAYFDLFNHRIISLYYRVWVKYSFAINYNQTQGHDSFSNVINSLTRTSTDVGKYYAGLFHHRIRTVKGLKQILDHYTGCKTEIRQFVGRWHTLSEHDQTRLAERSQPEGQFACLGVDTSIGDKVWNINSRINIVLVPPAKLKIDSYLKGGEINRLIKLVISSYLGNQTKFNILLKIERRQMPLVSLSDGDVPLGMGSGLCYLKKNEKLSSIISL
ncbi:MAG: type VI secretion system baseplate subunit TssG [Psychromonas sp.]|nr:type VI secretion system baseplate subunit TssG [Psychromonas sp.]